MLNEYSTDALDPVTDNEVILAPERFGNALDGIQNRALKMAIKHCVRPFPKMYKKFYDDGGFSRIWKIKNWYYYLKQENRQDLIRFWNDWSVTVWNNALKGNPKTSLKNQCGFRRGRSTIDSIKKLTTIAGHAIEGIRWIHGSKEYYVVIILDSRNAFNSICWSHIIRALRTI